MLKQSSIRLVAISLWACCCAQTTQAESPVVISEFIYTSAPFPECHASTIVETAAGTLVAAWFGGTEEGHSDVGIWLSRHIDGAWTAPVEVADGVQSDDKRYPTWNPVLFQPREGPLLLFFKVGPNPREWWGEVMVSADDGVTWTPPHRLPDGGIGPVKNKPIQMEDGSIWCASSTEHDGWRVHLEITHDLGESWQRTEPLNQAGTHAIQPSLLTYADGRLQMLCRNRNAKGDLWQCWSSGGGQTWSDFTSSGLPNPNAGTDAVTLRDGRQLLVYNHTHRGGPFPSGRNFLNVAVSDDGEKWSAALVLERSPGEYSYPAVIQTRDDRVHITYTWKRQRIRHVVLDPDRLELTPIVEGVWPDGVEQLAANDQQPASPVKAAINDQAPPQLERVKYRSPDLVVDLGVGLWAWPLPLDWDEDGDLDLVITCPDVPYRGTYFFENPGGAAMPVFRPAVKVGPGLRNASVSYVDGQARVLVPGQELVGFRESGFERSIEIYSEANVHPNRVRANQWKYVDYDGDGALDLILGVGDWTTYGWDNAFDRTGQWTRGPLRGLVYLLRNTGTTTMPSYASPALIDADGTPVDVYGMPSPNLADFDSDGDLDLLCGEFLDGFTYFENIGSRADPRYAAGRRLMHEGQPLAMDLQMIVPTAVDWDADGDIDLVVGDEDGRVALVEHTGAVRDGLPQFSPPRYFQQQADDVKFGALVTPVSADWDGDGDEDLVCGNTAGYIGLIENLDGGDPPRWAAPRYLEAGGETIRVQAGPNGSIQGPCEAKWGYTTIEVADWNHDGLLDIVANSIWGKVHWYENVGRPGKPQLSAAQPIEVEWPSKSARPKPAWNWWEPEGNELATQWRTTPLVFDLDADGLHDLVMLDHEGYLAWYQRSRDGVRLTLQPGQRVFFDTDGNPLRLNDREAGRSGRRKLCLTDWDGDGRVDLLVNSENVDLWRNISTDGQRWVFQHLGPLAQRKLAGHTTSPTTVDWDGDGRRDLLVGAEDGFLYYLPNRP